MPDFPSIVAEKVSFFESGDQKRFDSIESGIEI